MRIEFDANSPTELSAVFVAIAVLRGGDLSLPSIGDLDFDASDSELSGGDANASRVTGMHKTSALEPVPAAPIDTNALAVHRPPAAVAPAPPVPPAPPAAPAPAGAVELDADGLPWDNRIHSTPASRKKDGRWRGKRGLDDATRVAVTAELKQVMAAAPPAPVSPVPPPMFEEAAPGVPLPPQPSEPPADAATAFGAAGATPAPNTPPAPPVAAVPPAPPVAAVPPAPVAPPAAAVPEAPAPATDFAGLMRKITGLQSAGALTVEGTTQIATSLGITGVRDLMHRPDLIPSFDALLPVAG